MVRQFPKSASVYEELTRSMNARERAHLNEWAANASPVTVGGTIKWIFAWTVGFFFCAIAFSTVATGLNWLSVNGFVVGIIVAPFAIATIICFCAILVLISSYLRWSRYHRDLVRDVVPQIIAALEDGTVFVKKASASAVVEIVEFDDEGSGYIYDVGDGKVLFLKGQWVYPVDEEMPWPNSEFEIVRTVHGNLLIGIFCSGQELVPVREIETFECVDEIAWADREELLDGDIEQFTTSIMKTS